MTCKSNKPFHPQVDTDQCFVMAIGSKFEHWLLRKIMHNLIYLYLMYLGYIVE